MRMHMNTQTHARCASMQAVKTLMFTILARAVSAQNLNSSCTVSESLILLDWVRITRLNLSQIEASFLKSHQSQERKFFNLKEMYIKRQTKTCHSPPFFL